MNEIEIKARLQEPEKIIQGLAALGCELSEPFVQDDAVFLKRGLSYAEVRNAEVFLRIRKQSGKNIFTLKKARSNELDCLEKETVVQDAEALAEILDILGYDQVMRIVKTRRRGKCQGYEICVDEVEGLGWFMETEAFSEEPADQIQAKMRDWMRGLGIAEQDIVVLGYDTLLYNKAQDIAV